jgi:folate-binding protein YgfZ
MHTSWRQCLETGGARIDDNAPASVRHFGAPRAESLAAQQGNVLCDLSQYALLRVAGEDAREFLHNQLTTDLRQLSPEKSPLTAWCNPKGRMLALPRLSLRGDAFLLRLPATVLPAVQKRLQMFVLRSRVQLADASEGFARLGVSGPDAPARLETLLGVVPAAVNSARQSETVTVTRTPGPFQRFELIGPAETLIGLWESLTPDFQPVGEPAWRLLEVLSGLPEVYPETREAFIPQMTNLHWLGGVDWRKGCYPGQEVVARMHYLGKLKRRMYLARADTDSTPAPGAPVQAAADAQNAGTVVHGAAHPEGGSVLLAVLKIAAAESGELALEDSSRLALQPLPYATPDKQSNRS